MSVDGHFLAAAPPVIEACLLQDHHESTLSPTMILRTDACAVFSEALKATR